MSDLNKLGSALTIVFVVSLVALVAQLFYVLWRRRLFHRNNPAVHGGDLPEFSGDGHSTTSSPSPSSSKELLYFLCLKTQTRIGPSGAPPDRVSDGLALEYPPEEGIDVFKLQQMYGPSRVLFTIKEEEREDTESENRLQVVAGDSPEVAVTIEGDVIDVTPFTTPCASPPFYTPAASPNREQVASG